jgi:hypothetical protein
MTRLSAVLSTSAVHDFDYLNPLPGAVPKTTLFGRSWKAHKSELQMHANRIVEKMLRPNRLIDAWQGR